MGVNKGTRASIIVFSVRLDSHMGIIDLIYTCVRLVREKEVLKNSLFKQKSH
jgi:hypothetical protein